MKIKHGQDHLKLITNRSDTSKIHSQEETRIRKVLGLKEKEQLEQVEFIYKKKFNKNLQIKLSRQQRYRSLDRSQREQQNSFQIKDSRDDILCLIVRIEIIKMVIGIIETEKYEFVASASLQDVIGYRYQQQQIWAIKVVSVYIEGYKMINELINGSLVLKKEPGTKMQFIGGRHKLEILQEIINNSL